jgi:hypothetical protein
MELVPVQRPKGQPLLVFAIVIGGWLVLRVLLWEPPFGGAAPARTIAEGSAGLASGARTVRVHAGTRQQPPERLAQAPAERGAAPKLRSAPPAPAARLLPGMPGTIVLSFAAPHTQDMDPAALEAGRPAELKTRPGPGSPRWSGDAWLLLRKDSAAPLGAGRPSYGRSQAGAVLRYRLGAATGHRPIAYVRATRALAGPRERELAAGVAARPLSNLPVSVAVEVRVHEHTTGSETRVAAFAVTELPPARLPLGLRGELYAQAGYVGGTYATAFADGQMRVDKAVAGREGANELRLGAVVSGGAQKRAGRLDIGPSATVSFPLGEAYSRLALDYRFRVAGDAEPGNGPALTFSAGF